MKAKQNFFAVIELDFSVLSQGLCQTSNSAVAYEKNEFTQIERIHLTWLLLSILFVGSR